MRAKTICSCLCFLAIGTLSWSSAQAGRSPNRDWNSHRHWSWSGLPAPVLLRLSLRVSLLLSTPGLRSTGTGLCGAAPDLRACGTRLPATGSSLPAVLLYAVAVSFDADQCGIASTTVAASTVVAASATVNPCPCSTCGDRIVSGKNSVA